MISIRKQLLFSILTVLTLATIAVGIATYLGIRHELDELYDANMKQLAITAASVVADNRKTKEIPTHSNKWPHGEQIFLIQIWEGETLRYSTHPVVELPLLSKPGFGRVSFHGKNWSYYREDTQGKTIQVAQELNERRDVIREVYNAIIIPLIIQFPLVFILVWLLISYGFRSLSRISNLIQERTATFMQPIPLGKTPDEIRALVLALNDLLTRLQNALQTQKQFTADAAHELRTPLTAVRLQLDLLQRSKNEAERKEAVSILERGVSRSIHLVQQLLELARQEPDQSNEGFESIDLQYLVTDIIEGQKLLAQQKSISIQSDLQKIYSYGNREALAIMIGNILSNAIAYTPANGEIYIRVFEEDNHPILDISDSGMGIAPHERQRIFDRFYRVTGTGIPGSGLGLSIVKTIADRHGIDIQVHEGIDEKGTTFRLIFKP